MKRFALFLLLPLLLLGAVFVFVRYLTCAFVNPDKAWNIALMLDETANVGANGKVNTTISARAARARNAKRKWGCVLCWVLDKVQPRHCDRSIAGRESN